MQIIAITSALGFPSLFACLLWVMKQVKASRDEAKAKDKSTNNKIDILMAALQTQQRDRLLQMYKEYITQGWVDVDDLQNWEALYQTYHKLGANGVLDAKRAQLLQLPNIPQN